jgi:radical SAM superfamily enzyme YgiQ (UPF0313 family)
LKLCLVRPRIEQRKSLQAPRPTWRAARAIHNRFSPIKLGFSFEIPSLALATLAALTPDDIEIAILDEDIEEVDFDIDVDLVGISLLTMSSTRGYQIADEFRRRGVKVVLGGMHASVLPQEAGAHADAVVIGEAENVWHQLLDDARNDRLKQFYRSDDFNPLRNLPLPRFNLLPKDKYITMNLVQASRGCPNRCSFCSVHAVSGYRYRCKPVRHVVSEIEQFSEPLAVFLDDNMIGDKRYARRLFKAMMPMGLSWIGQATLCLAEDEGLLSLAAKSGCKGLLIGFESLTKENIAKLGKSKANTVGSYQESIKKIQAQGIRIAGSFIVGLDGDDQSVFDDTVGFIQRNNIDLPQVGVLTPYPGTRLFAQMAREGRIIHRDWHRYSPPVGNVVFKPKRMTAEELAAGQLYAQKEISSYSRSMGRVLSNRRNGSLMSSLFVMAYNTMVRGDALKKTKANLNHQALARDLDTLVSAHPVDR